MSARLPGTADDLSEIDDVLAIMPSTLRQVIAGNHVMLAEICSGLARMIDATPPAELAALMKVVRAGLRRIAKHHAEDVDEKMPEFAGWTRLVREHLQLQIADLLKVQPAQMAAWAAEHQRAATMVGVSQQ